MKRGIPKAAIVMTLGAVCVFGMAAGGAKSTQVTFTKDVAPILLNRCVECHRPGEVAPMSLLTYQDVRPWAKSIKEKVLERGMPPWFADPQYGEFENDRRLPQKEIDTLVAWVNAGAPKGDDKDMPPAPRFVEGWSLGQPDVVLTMQEEFSVPAEGVVPYKYFTVPTNFTEDKWIQGVELRSGNRGVVHHIIAFVLEPGQKGTGEGPTGNVLGGTAPGDPPTKYPDGMAKFLKAGSKLVLQMHYTPNGEPAKDRSSVGIFFAKAPVKKTARTGTAMNARFVIPPGRSQLRGEIRLDSKRGCAPVRLHATHARSRKRFHLHSGLPGWKVRDSRAGAEIRLQLAARLSAQASACPSKGEPDRMCRPF